MSDSLGPYGLQHARLPCPLLSPGVHSDSCPLSQWCYLTISSSAAPSSFVKWYNLSKWPMISFVNNWRNEIHVYLPWCWTDQALFMGIWHPLQLSLGVTDTGLLFIHSWSVDDNFWLLRWLNGNESTCQAGDEGSIPGWGKTLEKEMATYSNILAWEIPWTEEPNRLQSMGLQESDMT